MTPSDAIQAAVIRQSSRDAMEWARSGSAVLFVLTFGDLFFTGFIPKTLEGALLVVFLANLMICIFIANGCYGIIHEHVSKLPDQEVEERHRVKPQNLFMAIVYSAIISFVFVLFFIPAQ